MNYDDKIYLIKTEIVLFFFSLFCYVFELTHNENPGSAAVVITCSFLTMSTFVFCLAIFLTKHHKKQEQKKESVKVNNSSAQQLLDQIKEVSLEATSLKYKLQTSNKNEEDSLKIFKGILEFKKETIESTFQRLYLDIEDSGAKDLITKFVTAYLKLMDQVESIKDFNKYTTMAKLDSLYLSNKKEDALKMILSRTQKKVDQFFDLELSR